MFCFSKYLELKCLVPIQPFHLFNPESRIVLQTIFLYFFSFPKVQDLHTKLSSESKRADILAFEMKRLEEKHEALLKEKEVMFDEKCGVFIALNCPNPNS